MSGWNREAKYCALDVPVGLLPSVDVRESAHWCVSTGIEYLLQFLVGCSDWQLHTLLGLENGDHDKGQLLAFIRQLGSAILVYTVRLSINLHYVGVSNFEQTNAMVAMILEKGHGWATVVEAGIESGFERILEDVVWNQFDGHIEYFMHGM